MNNKGFTLVELLATLVILSIVIGITITTMNLNFRDTKEKTEDVFVDTIRDAIDVYLDSDAKSLSFTEFKNNEGKDICINKKYGEVNVKKVDVTFDKVISSKYRPITEGDLVNPANEKVSCGEPNNIKLTVYRDEDFVYYYSINKSEFALDGKDSCLLNNSSKVKETKKDEYGNDINIYYSDVISNLPEIKVCDSE